MPYKPDIANAIDDLIVVANTEHGPEALYPMPVSGADKDHYDHLRTSGEAVAFLRARLSALPAGEPDARARADLLELRNGTRALAAGREVTFRRSFRILSKRFRYRIEADGFVPDRGGWQGFAAALVPALGTLAACRERLRVCANPGCEWVFYDRSRKGHKIWCEASACGNRSKVRRFRERERRTTATRRRPATP